MSRFCNSFYFPQLISSCAPVQQSSNSGEGASHSGVSADRTTETGSGKMRSEALSRKKWSLQLTNPVLQISSFQGSNSVTVLRLDTCWFAFHRKLVSDSLVRLIEVPAFSQQQKTVQNLA